MILARKAVALWSTCLLAAIAGYLGWQYPQILPGVDLVEQARVLRYQKRYDEALACISEAIRRNPQRSEAWSRRADIRVYLWQLSAALDDAKTAVSLDPQSPPAYVARGAALEYLNRQAEAMKNFEQAIYLDPSYKFSYMNRGILYSRASNYKLAIKDFKKVIALDPKYVDGYNGLAYAENNIGHLEESIAALTGLLLWLPKTIMPWQNVAECSWTMSNIVQQSPISISACGYIQKTTTPVARADLPIWASKSTKQPWKTLIEL